MSETVCKITSVSVRLRNRIRLHSTSLLITAGTITAIVGPNGSGKSTLLGTISGEIRPSCGSVELNGHDITALNASERARLRAMLAQDTPTTFAFTVREVVSWGRFCWARTRGNERDAQVINAVIDRLNLGHIADRPVTQLSAGEKSRVQLARVLAQEASLVLLDEADADLDLGGRIHLAEVVRTLRDQGTTVILVTHDLARVNAVADHVVGMKNGKITFEGPQLNAHAVKELFEVRECEARRVLGI